MGTSPSVVVVGPGAIGTIVATRLAATCDVTVACRTAATAKLLARDGLSSADMRGRTTHARVETVTHPRDVNADWVVLATRCQDAVKAAKKWDLGVPILAMQNGLLGDQLRTVCDTLLMTTVAFPATRTGPGQSQQTGPGGFHLGAWPDGNHSDAAEACRILTAVAPSHAHTNMLGVAWSKLLINSCITTLGAVTGEGLGSLLRRRSARDVFLAIIREGRAVAHAEGVALANLDSFRPGLLAAGGGARPVQHALLRIAARKQRKHRSSSLQALERGGGTEVPYLNGRILEGARTHGIDVPVNAALVEAARAIEKGSPPGMAWLDRIPT